MKSIIAVLDLKLLTGCFFFSLFIAPSTSYDLLPLATNLSLRFFLIPLVHRSGGLPIGYIVGGLSFIIILVQRSSVILAMYPVVCPVLSNPVICHFVSLHKALLSLM